MTSTVHERTADGRWAPWWVYVGVIVGGNYLRQWLLPFGTVPEWADVVIAVVLAGLLFVGTTFAYRTGRR